MAVIKMKIPKLRNHIMNTMFKMYSRAIDRLYDTITIKLVSIKK